MQKLRSLLAPLRVFDALNRAGSVTKAAEALHVTPGAVSQQLKQLELGLGVPLFRKDGRAIGLTDTGLKLARRVADAFDRLEAALAEVGEARSSRRLRLKVMPTFAIRWLLPRLADFYTLHSDIDVEVSTTSRPSDFELDHSDFVVRHGVGQWEDVEFDHVFDDAFIPVCCAEMAATITRPEDVLKANLLHSIMRPAGWDIWLEAAGLGAQKSVRNLTLGNAAMCYQGAIEGLGVAIAQRAYVEDDLKTGRLVAPLALEATSEAGYYFVSDPMKADNPAVQAFRSWIRSRR